MSAATDSAAQTAVHQARTVDVAVDGGVLRVVVWEPTDAAPDAPTALLVHGVTASHKAWPFIVQRLPGVRLIAPDLRGRGRSNAVAGPAGLTAHADDLAAVLDALDVDRTVVVGHSMGAFVSVAFAHRHPDRVAELVLIDGGMPLDVPTGLDADALVSHILGPAAERLSMRFASVEAYLDFWRDHPAFRNDWTREVEEYLAYDLQPEPDGLRPATSYATMVDDTVDMNTGSTLPDALAGLRHPTVLVTVPRGLLDEPPGLYAPEHVERVLEQLTQIDHHRIDGFNHYTIVMSAAGADAIAPFIAAAVAR